MNTKKDKAAPLIEGDRFDEDRAAFTEIAEAAMASENAANRPSAWSPAFCAARCPDQWVGTVRFENERLRCILNDGEPSDRFLFRRPTSDLSASGPRRLLMILESPHVSEFSGSEGAIGPAAGATGQSIRSLLGHVAILGTEKLIARPGGEDLALVLINAIQHQTSLGHATRHFRDEVFGKAWKSGRIGRRRFLSRMEELWRPVSRDIVLNCCTGGERRKASLKHRVYDVLREIADNNPMRPPLVVGCAHPSSWQRNKNNREARVVELGPRVNAPTGAADV